MNPMRFIVLLALFVISFTGSAIPSSLSFEQAWVRMLPPTSEHTAAYVNIVNNGGEQDTLIDVSSNSANMLMLHQSVSENGVMKMLHADNLIIPAKDTVSLTPGGYHVMIMGLHKPLTENSKLTLTFEFEKAGKISVEFPVIKK